MTGKELFAALEATWPPASQARRGPWTMRDGAGGGKRVSAATLEGAGIPADAPDLIMVRQGEDALDAALDARGYNLVDPTLAYAIPVTELTQAPLKPVSAFHIWPPLAIQCDLWARAGTSPARLAVMGRVEGQKAAILARNKDQPAGVGFVAMHRHTAMIHAIEVAPAHRRQGVGRNILRCAAHWAQDRGAETLSLLVTCQNRAANTLYTSLGMRVVGHYHYRIKNE